MGTGARRAFLFAACAVLVACFVFPSQAIHVGQLIADRFAQAFLGRPTTAVGAGRQSSTVDLLGEVYSLQERFQKQMERREPFPADLVNALEALMQPSMPYEVRARAMRAGQVIGGKRFSRVLLEAMKDPNPAIRRTAVGKANDCPGLAPEMAPPEIARDSDPGTRSAFDYWTTMHAIRVRNGESIRALPGAPGSPTNPD